MSEIETQENVGDLFTRFGTSEAGLSTDEARKRLEHHGLNIGNPRKKKDFIKTFVRQIKNWFNLMLLVSAILSYVTGMVSQDQGSFQAGTALVVVTFLNTFFSIIQEYRANRFVQAIHALIPMKAKVVRDGQAILVDITEIVPGDLVLLEEGDNVPADIRLTSAFEVTVNSSVITGESDPQRKSAECTVRSNGLHLADIQNVLLAGTNLTTGIAKGIVIKTGVETQMGRIVSLSAQSREPPSTLQLEVDRSAKLTLFIATGIGFIFFSIALGFVGITLFNSTLFAIGVMMCLVPQGLQMTLSLSKAVTAYNMAKRNVVIKRHSCIETLGAMTVLCVDKTGTMTSGEMMVEKVWAGGKLFHVTGDGYNPKGLIVEATGKLASKMHSPLSSVLEASALCNNAKLVEPKDKLSRWTVLGDPTDGAFLVLAEKGDSRLHTVEGTRMYLIPFESKRRMMTSIHSGERGRVTAYTKGAGADVLGRCTSILLQEGLVELTMDARNVITEEIDILATQGYRVLAIARKDLSDEENEKWCRCGPQAEVAGEIESRMTFLGIAAIADPPRPRVKEAVLQARHAGIKVIMLTGDSEVTAEVIARRIGIVSSQDPTVITGHQLDALDQPSLLQALAGQEVVFARILPDQKLKIVQALRSNGEVVGVTGDGVNDAPALMEANVGVAMGVGGTDVAREAADMILLDNNFASVVESIKYGRAGFKNLKKFVGYIYTHNFAELGAFIAFVILGIPLPLSVVQILAIDLGMDVLPSLSLIMEPPSQGLMDQPPRKSNSLLDARVLIRAASFGTFVSIVVLGLAFNTWMSAGWIFGESLVEDRNAYAMGMTIVMVGIMGGQVGNLLSIRTSRNSALKIPLLANKWVIFGILWQFGFMISIVYLPFFQVVFGTAALSITDLLILYSLAFIVLAIDELRKFFLRRLPPGMIGFRLETERQGENSRE